MKPLISYGSENCFYPDPIWIFFSSWLWFYSHYLSLPLLPLQSDLGWKGLFLRPRLIKTFYTSLHEFLFPLSVLSWVQSFHCHAFAALGPSFIQGPFYPGRKTCCCPLTKISHHHYHHLRNLPHNHQKSISSWLI